MKNDYRICFAAIGSVTQAMKAQQVLAGAAVPCEVIKSDSSASRRGCIYGLKFSCAQENNVRTILNSAKIRVSAWERN
ncbi:MAG: putative Se/S carrier-like protein [Eubacteriales bacterium]